MSELNELEQLFAEATAHYTIRLPTLGFFNSPEDFEPGVDFDNFLVKQFSVMQDLHFRNPHLILSGKATMSMLKTVAPQILNPKKMTNADVSAIMLAARIVSHGSKLKISHTCTNPEVHTEGENKGKPVCTHASTYDVDLEQVLLNFPSLTLEEIDAWKIVVNDPGKPAFTLRFKLLNFVDAVNIAKELAMYTRLARMSEDDAFYNLPQEKQSEIEEEAASHLVNAQFIRLYSSIREIESANGKKFTDSAMITKAINSDSFPMAWVDVISTKLTELHERFDKAMLIPVVCQSCGFETENVNISTLSENFFGPTSEG